MVRADGESTACLFTVAMLLLAGTAAGAGEVTAPGSPRPNPYLVQTYSPMTHLDPAQQDSVAVPAPVGVQRIDGADSRWVPGRLVNIGFQVFPVLKDGDIGLGGLLRFMRVETSEFPRK